ncbi:hypothetical protein C8R42DRAFT_651683 [Lentinula raphanica]|nr:hypothetical protein C8R42DRAFT_651683 [Lentinula raphanica]
MLSLRTEELCEAVSEENLISQLVHSGYRDEVIGYVRGMESVFEGSRRLRGFRLSYAWSIGDKVLPFPEEMIRRPRIRIYRIPSFPVG